MNDERQPSSSPRKARFLGLLVIVVTIAGALSGVSAAVRHLAQGMSHSGSVPPGLAPVVAASLAPPEYHLTPASAGRWQAANPAQDLSAAFSPGGLLVAPAGGGSVQMSLARIGRSGALSAPAPAEVVAAGARVEYRRGALTEWYVNDHRGVEQGFTLAAPPAAGAAGRPVVVELASAGELRPTLDPTGTTVRFDGPGGGLDYGGLFAFDAAGRSLPSRLGLEGATITLTVDDAGAAYPITIDPLLVSQEAHLFASDASADDRFGFSVAISGDTAVVGAHKSGLDSLEGSAYVFVRTGATWTEQARLSAPASGRFGWSVAIDGDTAVVGARAQNVGGAVLAGAAHVYVRSGAAWTLQAQLLASDGSYDDQFGNAVAIQGDTVFVAAEFDDTPIGANAGSVYVFERAGSYWTERDHLFTTDGDNVGSSLAIAGDTLLVGADADDTDAGGAAGSVYVFVRSGTTWAQQAQLHAADAAATDIFGVSVAISGDTAVVGASNDDNVGGSNAGSAYVFMRSGTTWTQQAKVRASDGGGNEYFGTSVAVSGDVVLVGAPADGMNGSAYAFVRAGASWMQQGRWPGTSSDHLGTSMAVSGDTLVAGAAGNSDTIGSAYIFDLDPPIDHLALSPAAATVAPGTSQAFTARAIEPDGDDLGDVTSDTAFSIAPDGSCTGVACTATTPGVHTVTGTRHGVTGTATLTVTDVVAPVVSVPAPISVTPTDGSGGAVVTYDVTASDDDPSNPHPAVTCTPPSGSTFPIGTTTVTCTSTDFGGNTSTGTFTVTVRDEVAPVLTLPTPITVDPTGPSGAVVNFTASATDNDPARPNPVVTCTPPSGSTFPIGTTTVTCTASDSSGNLATNTFTVTVGGADDLFAKLVAASQNLGPGNSVLGKVVKAQERFLAGDVAGACGGLDDYIKQVNLHSPKHIDPATVTARIADANQIRRILGCS